MSSSVSMDKESNVCHVHTEPKKKKIIAPLCIQLSEYKTSMNIFSSFFLFIWQLETVFATFIKCIDVFKQWFSVILCQRNRENKKLTRIDTKYIIQTRTTWTYVSVFQFLAYFSLDLTIFLFLNNDRQTNVSFFFALLISMMSQHGIWKVKRFNFFLCVCRLKLHDDMWFW